MKKVISAVALISILLTSSALAQNIPNHLFSKPNKPVVTVGGFVNFTAAGRSQEPSFSEERFKDVAFVDNGGDEVSVGGTHNNLSKDYSFSNDSEIYIKVGAISDTGMKYGAIIELEAGVTSDAFDQGLNADKSFIFVESDIGKFEFGNNNGVNQKMKVGPQVFARATGGISGLYVQHLNFPMLAHSTQLENGVAEVCNGGLGSEGNITNPMPPFECDNIKLPRFIIIPQSPVAHGGYSSSFYSRVTDNQYLTDGDFTLVPESGSFNANSEADPVFGYKDGSFGRMEDATKISYYTPRISGLQFGLSFTPDTGDNGTATSISGANSGDIENVFSWGANYSKNFGNLGFAASVTGENGKFEDSSVVYSNQDDEIGRENLASYDLGIMFTYFGFTIGGSYGFWGDSLSPDNGIYSCQYDPNSTLANQTCNSDTQAEIVEFDDSSYYTAGLAYEIGPFAASLTHLESEFQKNEYTATSFGVDYKLARGLLPYFEVTKFEFNSNQPSFANLEDQNTISNAQRQLRDNSGFIALAGILLSF